ncbi:DUF423 domain-containing protein [Verrucomicrobium sp. BvORR106]|uniref:DUF423 domain-containing protein n=1 Tax=Verrucomicrobium sp. BvORR106 TaxID=1403819 RepID=UPI000571D1A9|nr:DUF423 domain-containing protein [Verrucomicrobium sp. BvORR106]
MKVDLLKLRIAGIMGFLAVGLGAMGAHALKKAWDASLSATDAAYRMEIWKTASLYHLVHAVVLLILAYTYSDRNRGKGAFWSFVVGVFLFSGSLYTLCLTGFTKLGAVTPFGGVLIMLGWLLLMFPGKRDQV